jgi:hypothetical protein
MTGAALEAAVEALIERDAIVSRAHADLQIQGELRRVAGRWHARVMPVELGGSPSQARELIGDARCNSLDRALVIVVATLLDRREPARERPSRFPLSMGVSGGALIKTLSAPLFRAALSVSLELADGVEAALDVGGSLLVRTAAAEAGRSATFQVFDADLSLCPRLLAVARFELFGCGGASLGLIYARGLGFDASASEARLSTTAFVTVALQLQLFGQMAVRLAAGPVLALARPRFYYEDRAGQARQLEQPQLFGAQLRLGFIVNAPARH